MFKLPNLPSTEADTPELADFAELLCWVNGSTSKREIVAYLGRLDDNDDNVGCDDDDDKNSDSIDEVMVEIERRASACGSGYPFHLDTEGTVLRHDEENVVHQAQIYRYLLLGTRLNMKKNGTQAQVDGALLFEEVCAHILKNFLGGERARSLVFGTASQGSFEDKVNALCHHLGEGAGYRNLNTAPEQAKDGKLDVVAWIPFSDQKVGQLIIFSQCKTGTSWEDQVSHLQPTAFINKWIDGAVAVHPVRSLCVSEAFSRAHWHTICIDAGILFDRCRIVDFCPVLEKKLIDKVGRWTAAAKKNIKLSAVVNAA
jgi:hypothetical protein